MAAAHEAILRSLLELGSFCAFYSWRVTAFQLESGNFMPNGAESYQQPTYLRAPPFPALDSIQDR